jgi:magnesium chelatase family protein
MLVRVRSGAVLGVSAVPVDVEVEASLGFPGFHLVGLAAGPVQEAKVRVQAAVRNLDIKLPQKDRTVSGSRARARPRRHRPSAARPRGGSARRGRS